jgi:hypothetical protein
MNLYADAIALGVSNRQATSTFRIHIPDVFAQMVRASMDAGLELLKPAPLDEPDPAPLPALPQPESQARSIVRAATRNPASAESNGRWSALFATDRTAPWLGQLLAEHPQAADNARRVLNGMSVERLVLLANVQHNRCRRSALADALQVSREHTSERAWNLLLTGLCDMQMRDGTAWTGTIKLLSPGSEAALQRINRMGIADIIGVCQRLIQIPYTEARLRGIT